MQYTHLDVFRCRLRCTQTKACAHMYRTTHTHTSMHTHCQLHKTACSTQLHTHLRVGADAHADEVMQELPVEGSHGRQRVLNHPLLQSQRREQCTTTVGWVYKHHHMRTLVRTQCFRAYQGVREWRGCYSITGHGAYVRI